MTGPLVLSTAAVCEPCGTSTAARWCYDPAEPYAVTLSVRHRGHSWVDWLLARDLLAAGLLAAVGVGDVTVEPYPGDGLLVTLDSPSGHALLRLDARHAERALMGSYALVPAESEGEHLDWDVAHELLLLEEIPDAPLRGAESPQGRLQAPRTRDNRPEGQSGDAGGSR